MTVPEFPAARPILLEDKPLFDRLLAAVRPAISQYTFTNVFAWRRFRNTSISKLRELLLVFEELPNKRIYLQPIGPGEIASAIELCLSSSRGHAAEFEYVSADVAAQAQDNPRLVVEPDRDNSDYLYSVQDLVELPGRSYDGKRNFIRRFKAKHPYRYLSLNDQTTVRCMEFQERWCRDRSCQSDEGLSQEHEAILEMLQDFRALELKGGAIEVAGEIVAFTLGEALNPETLVVHVEKADAKLKGVYAVINNEFCRHGGAGYKYVNREQDLGVPGLRKAKLSYHPLSIVPAFRIRLRTTGN